jgi:hypothetical protein
MRAESSIRPLFDSSDDVEKSLLRPVIRRESIATAEPPGLPYTQVAAGSSPAPPIRTRVATARGLERMRADGSVDGLGELA